MEHEFRILRKKIFKYLREGWEIQEFEDNHIIISPDGSCYDGRNLDFGYCPVCTDNAGYSIDENFGEECIHDEELTREIDKAFILNNLYREHKFHCILPVPTKFK